MVLFSGFLESDGVSQFVISIAFPSDCRSCSSFLESVEFLRMTLKPAQMSHAQTEICGLRKANDGLHSAVDSLRSVKTQQDQLIQELTKLLAGLNVSQ
jgi:hypothetical protein